MTTLDGAESTATAPTGEPGNPSSTSRVVFRHRLSTRLWHWVNVVAFTLMLLSGWRIYNASPVFDFSFPKSITLGGWLGGAIQWHFAAMWLFAANGLAYVASASCPATSAENCYRSHRAACSTRYWRPCAASSRTRTFRSTTPHSAPPTCR